MALTKSDIVKNIAENTGFTKQDSKELLDHFLDQIKFSLKNSISVKISNFGTFEVKKTPARIGRNPKTKEEHIISERDRIILNPSKNIRDFLN